MTSSASHEPEHSSPLAEDRYRAPGPEFPLYNLHAPALVSAVQEFLLGETDSSIALLSGVEAAGRRYLAQAAAEELRQERRGDPLILIVDLQDFEESAPFESFVKLSAEKLAKQAIKSSELVNAFEGLTQLSAKSSAEAALLQLAMQIYQSSFKPLIQTLLTPPDSARSQLPGREALVQLLEELAQRRTIVLHLLHSAQLSQPLRNHLCLAAQKTAGLKIVLSCHPSDVVDRMTPLPHLHEDPLRFEVVPLAQQSLEAALLHRYPRHHLPAELSAALVRYSGGSAGLAATKLHHLLTSGALTEEPDLQLRHRLPVSQLIGSSFGDSLLQPILELVESPEIEWTNGRLLLRVLEASALCGRLVPIQLILAYLEVTDEQKDEILELIDDHLVEGELPLFEDYWTEHPGFLGIPTVEFFDPLLRFALLYQQRGADRAETAASLLRFLRGRLPPRTRSAALLYRELATHLEEEEAPFRDDVLRDLDWWIGNSEADSLRDHLIEQVQDGSLEPSLLWAIASQRGDWPPYRRLAVLDAFEQVTVRRQPQPSEGQLAEPATDNVATADTALGMPEGLRESFFTLQLNLLVNAGKYEGALDAAKSTREALGEEPSQTLLIVRLHQHQAEAELNHLDQALDGARETLSLAERHLGQDHSLTISGQRLLAMILRNKGILRESLELMRGVVPKFQSALGHKHHNTLVARAELGNLLLLNGQTEEAVAMLEDVVEESRQSLGRMSPGTLGAERLLVKALNNAGAKSQALDLANKTLNNSRRVFGGKHLNTLILRHLIVRIHRDSGEIDPGAQVFRELLQDTSRVLGSRDSQTIRVRFDLALTLQDLNDYPSALGHLQQAFLDFQAVLGETHPTTISTAKALAETLEALHRHDEAQALLDGLPDEAAEESPNATDAS
ncbi:MAG: tetratricopeptide repeat protein [Acidobacteriota bacterium]